LVRRLVLAGLVVLAVLALSYGALAYLASKAFEANEVEKQLTDQELRESAFEGVSFPADATDGYLYMYGWQDYVYRVRFKSSTESAEAFLEELVGNPGASAEPDDIEHFSKLYSGQEQPERWMPTTPSQAVAYDSQDSENRSYDWILAIKSDHEGTSTVWLEFHVM